MREPVVSPSERLLAIASDVRKIGYGYRSDPERVAIQKDDVAYRLVEIARELERQR